MKKLMVIAGGTWQVPLIKKAKTLGYEVLNSNLYEDSPGFEYADYTEVSDVRDKNTNLSIAKKYGIDGVLTDQSDIAVPTVAYVAEQLGCVTIGCKMAELYTNKYMMREYCKQIGIPTPEYRLCSSMNEAIEFFENLNAKAIMKPLDSQSSRGIFTVETVEDIVEKFSITMSYTSSKKQILIERYIQGTEFTVDGIAIAGVHYCLAISEKSHFSYNENIASKLFFSYDNNQVDYEKLRIQNNMLVKQTGLKIGLTHAEYKYENGKFYLIEIAARGGGTKIASDIVPYLSGVDNYKILIQTALDDLDSEKINIQLDDISKKKCAILEFLDIESHGKKIKEIRGIEEIQQIPEVVDFCLEFKKGDVVEKAQDDRSRVGYFIVCAEDRQKVIEIEEKVKSTLKIEFI